MICQLVLEYFQLQLSDILFFLEAFGLFETFWPSKGLTAFLTPKNPKKASGLQKKKCLQASAENTPKKVDSSWKNACFLFIFGPISYWRAFFHDTIQSFTMWKDIHLSTFFELRHILRKWLFFHSLKKNFYTSKYKVGNT